MSNRKILGFDVSTTATGAVIYDESTKSHVWKLFTAKGQVTDRIKIIAKDIKEWIKDYDFDLVLITKAANAQMNQYIIQLEGILLGIAIDRDIDFDYYGDSSWYTLIGDSRDERPTKKANSVRRYLMENYKPNDVDRVEKKYRGDKLEKITVHMKDGTQITDDIADAFNAASLLIKREERKKIRFETDETQQSINKLSSEIKKINKKIPLIKEKINFTESERIILKKEYELTKHKGKLNQVMKREERIAEYSQEIANLEASKSKLEQERVKLREKKKGLK